jgi:lipoprotein-anchoring transpeptidase ErfK/SrfK
MKHLSPVKRFLVVIAASAVILAAVASGNHLVTVLNRQSAVNPDELSSLYNEFAGEAEFHGVSYEVPKDSSQNIFVANSGDSNQNTDVSQNTDVLGSKSRDAEKRYIAVDLSNQKLYMYENGKKIDSFLVSTGKWGLTPVGEFRIWVKLRYTLMTGGSKALSTYYYLPNVPYTMFFYNQNVPKTLGYGIHGAYWHNNFGHPMSHGCINMSIADAKTLFDWASSEKDSGLGTKIIIYGATPKS